MKCKSIGFISRSLETTAIENCIRHFRDRQGLLHRIRWLERKLARAPRPEVQGDEDADEPEAMHEVHDLWFRVFGQLAQQQAIP